MARKPVLPIRLDDEAKARWKAAADGQGQSLADWVRAAAEEKIARDTGAPPPERKAGHRVRVHAPDVPGGKVFRGPDPKRK